MPTPPREDRQPTEAELFRLLVENVRDYAIFVLDPEGRVQSWNCGAERLLGYEEDEILGQPCALFFTPEDRERGLPDLEIEQALTGGRGDDDRWHVRKDGSRFWAGGTLTPLWDDGRLRGFAKIMRDRTEWKRAEQERLATAKESDRRRRLYEAALSNTPDLVYVFDLQHRFVYANERLLAVWGRTWDEAIGRTCRELGYEPWHAAMHDREIDEVVATRRPVKGEVPFTGTFGQRIHEYILVPVLGPEGEVEAVAGTTRDVTERRHAEEQLRRSEQRFRSLIDQAPFSVQVFSPDGHTLRVNRAWEELWGVRLEQIEGYSILEDRQLEARGVMPFIREGFAGRTARVPAIEYDPNATIPGVTSDPDPRRWLSAVIYPIKDEQGQVREVVLIHEDITARKRAEDELRASEQRYRATFDNASIGVAHVGPDRRTLWVNPGLCAMLGYGEAEVLARTFREFTHPDDLDADLALARRLFAGEIPSYRIEKRYLHKDGSVVWADLAVSLVRDADGAPAYAVGVLVDITRRKQAEARLEAVLAGIDDHLVCYDRQWRFTFVNDKAADVLGKARDELLGRCLWDVFPDAVGNQYYRELHQALAEQRIIRSEHYYAPFGKWFENHIYPTREGVTVFSADVTLRKRLEEELRHHNERLAEADRRKDEFLATLAHELRNPLAPIRNSLQILRLPNVDTATAQRVRDVMERQVAHLVRLVDDLLDVSRVMRGKVALRREPVELATIVARGVETAQPLIEMRGHELQVSLPEESLPLDADPVRMAQVVANLLTNAAKYTEPGGRIRVSVHREGGEAVLSVRDNGTGIAPDILPHVFELFVQGDHSRAQGGLGIGLTLVKSLVELHDGRVEARSDGPGKGSEFVVRLPLRAPDPASAAARPEPEPAPPDTRPQGRRLLVVDDNQDAAASLATLLRLQGHDVAVAHDGPTALRLAREQRPELVFLDLGMPDMDGYEVARRLRAEPGLAGVRLAALTGWGQEDDRRRSAAAGFDHHLVKPPDAGTLEEVLGSLGPREE